MKRNPNTITLGSGKLYIKEFKESIGDVAQLIKDMATDEFLLGRIQGGASLEYKPNFYTAKDDFGYVTKTIIAEEEATLKSGICTWNGAVLEKLCATGRVTEDTANGLRIVKIGGISNDNGKIYVILFEHKDAEYGNVYLAIAGRNTAGFSLAFAKDKETVIDAEFSAQACDEEGTKIIYAEEIDKASDMEE